MLLRCSTAAAVVHTAAGNVAISILHVSCWWLDLIYFHTFKDERIYSNLQIYLVSVCPVVLVVCMVFMIIPMQDWKARVIDIRTPSAPETMVTII